MRVHTRSLLSVLLLGLLAVHFFAPVVSGLDFDDDGRSCFNFLPCCFVLLSLFFSHMVVPVFVAPYPSSPWPRCLCISTTLVSLSIMFIVVTVLLLPLLFHFVFIFKILTVP